MEQVLLFITNNSHSVARWFEIPKAKFTDELEKRIFAKKYGYSDYYSDDNEDNEYEFKNIDESEKLDKFLIIKKKAL